MPKKKPRRDPYGGRSLVAECHVPDAYEVELTAVLAALQEGPKHRDWLYKVAADPAAAVEELRYAGFTVVRYVYPDRAWDWCWALDEGGKICGVRYPS